MTKRERVRKASGTLEAIYGVPGGRGRANLLDVLVRTILSQNTNDENSGAAFAALKKAFRKWEEVLAASEKRIADAIRVGGLAGQKAKAIKGFLRWLKEERGELSLSFLRKIPDERVREILLQRKGVGLKTANVFLCFALGRDVFGVDTHVHRISRRLGFVGEGFSAERTSEAMGKLVPRGKAYSFHINLIRFGRERCRKRSPECPGCPMRRLCLYVKGKVTA